MSFTPSTEVILLNVPWDSTNKHHPNFSSPAAQRNFMINNSLFSSTDFTYQRKDNIVRYPKNIDSLWSINYCMYQNSNFSNKWFFAFVTKMEYVNNEVTALFLETDVIQTWYFDMVMLPCFVEREHVLSDNIGEHLLPENQPIIDYTSNEETTKMYTNYQIIIAAVTDAGGEQADGTILNNIYTGAIYYQAISANAANGIIDTFAANGNLSSIIDIFTIPFDPMDTGVSHSDEIRITRKYSLDGYIPKNNKLLTYPYSFLLITNNSGGTQELKYEFFENPSPSFTIYKVMSGNPSIICVPLQYQGRFINHDMSILIDNFPRSTWSGDTYANWLSLNYNKLVISGLQGVAAASPSSVISTISEVVAAKEYPPTATKGSNSNTGNNIALSNTGFRFYQMSVNAKNASIIDDFFEKYGYNISKLKIPNIKGRPHWNFVLTRDFNINGALPLEDLTKIKSIFNSGITLWTNPVNIGNYNLDNSIGSTPSPEPEPEPTPEIELVSPISGDWRNYVSSEFGWRQNPTGSGQDFHTGIDLAQATGTPIFATKAGTVSRVTNGTTGYGKYLIINHGNNFKTLYAHNSSILVSEGNTVTQGQKIAEMGATGNVTGPHLHFETLINGVAENPRNYLP